MGLEKEKGEKVFFFESKGIHTEKDYFARAERSRHGEEIVFGQRSTDEQTYFQEKTCLESLGSGKGLQTLRGCHFDHQESIFLF